MRMVSKRTRLLTLVFVLFVFLLLASNPIEASRRKQDAPAEDGKGEVLELTGPADHGSLDTPNVHTALREGPTREEDGWRRLDINESVPRGSHVRLNMTSGEKWVKIEEADDKGTVISTPIEQADPAMTKGERIVTLLAGIRDAELDQRLTAIRLLGPPGSDAFEDGAKDLWEERQAWLHGAKKEHDDGISKIKIDQSEPRLATLSREIGSPELVTLEQLDELDELVSDVGDAYTFANAKHEGIRKCLDIIDSEATTNEIKSKAATVLGSAIRGAEDLQNQTVALGGFQKLLNALKRGVVTEKQALSALGSLLRGSKDAAHEALRHPGFFRDLIQRLAKESAHDIRSRTAALVGDLLHEGEEQYWAAFRKAGLCDNAVDLSHNNDFHNKHISYLDEIRRVVCGSGMKQEL